MAMRMLVTGGAGFIGSTFVRHVLAHRDGVRVVNVDALTYAGNPDNLADVASHPGHCFVCADIRDEAAIHALFAAEKPEVVVHFAAESHVDRSILSPAPFVDTNVRGTFNLLEAARRTGVRTFVHVSTDEVYGSLEPPLEADETFPLEPSSVYSASKASSDLLALSYWRTYRLPVVVTRASNNYGPHQFPEKLIPLMICNALDDRPLPVYGDGQQVRDWLFAEDHCAAVLAVAASGRPGEVYNVGGSRSLTNLDVVRRILAITGRSESLITRVQDRPGHDRRYALSSAKLERETGWRPAMNFEEGLAATVRWYRENPDWVERVRSGAYREFYARNYTTRPAALDDARALAAAAPGPR